jgi:hypothetical protein
MQTTSRSQYIAQMRSRTAYPTFRALMIPSSFEAV